MQEENSVDNFYIVHSIEQFLALLF